MLNVRWLWTRMPAWLLVAYIVIGPCCSTSRQLFAQEPRTERDICYRPEGRSEYERARCKLDLYLPVSAPGFATLIWFHGGGLENGDKADAIALGVAKRFTEAGIAVASVNYRLSPNVSFPDYIHDAAAAVAHVHKTIESSGGDRRRVFVSGHSAGGYLTAMLATAPDYLAQEHIKPSDLAGFIPISGQMITHSTIRKERGIPKTRPVIDAAAPTWHVSEAMPPMLCVWADGDLPTRAEENVYFVAAAKAAGTKTIEALPVQKRSHETIASLMNQPSDEVSAAMLKFMGAHRAAENKKSALRVSRDEKSLAIYSGEKPLLAYNLQSPPAPQGIDPVYERSGFLHPVYSPEGQILTATFPADHVHQHGIFSAWVKTTYKGQAVDFWNLPGRTGRVLHHRVAAQFEDDQQAGFEVELLHRVMSDPPIDVVLENWKVTAHPTDGTYHCFDLETVQIALTDEPLMIEKYHYGGVAVRGPVAWLLSSDSDRKAVDSPRNETNTILNNLGQDRLAGNHAHAQWVAMSGQLQDKPTSIVMLDHPQNFRAPQAARLHPTKPYFCFAPCIDGQFVIDRDHPYHARYRFLITDTEADPNWLQKQWEHWAAR